ncbi:MAG: sensor histidine kinase, partial [Parasphingopyxis sp.]
LPSMPSHARSLLRHRKDLPRPVRDALERYGAADMILESSAGVAAANDAEAADRAVPDEVGAEQQGPAQIRRLVERIEAFRERRARAEAEVADRRIEEFRFEAGRDGVIRWVEGAPRGPLIGLSIAFSADALDFGVDGHAAGAFRSRAPFRDARLTVAGEGPAAGAWRISAVPFFTDEDGRFAGYRGMARRPRRGEEAGAAAEPGLFGSTLAPDSLRQLIHELRTPLNAIIGFSEMIEQQLLGPLPDAYRNRARMIAIEATRLIDSVDDLDTAARVETDRLALGPESVDVTEILTRLHDSYVEQVEARQVALIIRIEEGLPNLDTDAIAVERMIERLLAATVGLAAGGERIVVRCSTVGTDAMVAIAFDRPALLAGQSEDELLDPGYSPAGDWPDAPALGLGFALRLVRNVAREAGGRLEVTAQRFVLYLPAKDASACSGEQGR